MNHVIRTTFENYTRTGDFTVIAICTVMILLLFTSYVSRTKSFRIFSGIIAVLILAAFVNITYHEMIQLDNPDLFTLICILRILYQALLFDVFFLFALYTVEVSGLEHRKARMIAIGFTALVVIFVTVDIVRDLTSEGFQTAEDGTVVQNTSLFTIAYIVFSVLLILLLRRVRNLVYKRVLYGFYGTMAIAFLTRIGQQLLNQTSLTTMCFVFPVIGMFYIMHSNPYNLRLGTVDVRAMEDYVRNMHGRNEPFFFLSLLLPEFEGEGKELPEEIRAQVRRFSTSFFRGCVLFQIGNGHVILMVPKRRNENYEQNRAVILEAFDKQYQRFRHSYKIVTGQSIDEISRKNEYASLIHYVSRDMSENSIHHIEPDDIVKFNRNEYILHELADIHSKRDPDDPRVLAYCQPVFNLESGQFDTAEALMRLKLEETGMVFPDQFIPLAEEKGYIHALTEIILHKTCQEIRRLTEEGFLIKRVSVNVSVLELKDDAFCDDITRIIDSNKVSDGKVAFELTESNSEADFMIMKEKIEELRRKGIQFYLDDFGTGYSNMERIMELPFDIIKFDRSMVIASGMDERSANIVQSLARMFKDMKYSVLYEGIEDEKDEERCKAMSATYLQGYKYSRPVPIENLREFIPKVR